jgi:hypothetical protein
VVEPLVPRLHYPEPLRHHSNLRALQEQ